MAAAAAQSNVRVKNSKELRGFYTELKNAPDGLDPEPLTVPRCVECAHCGWPVWPREAKLATKKTYARAGIDRPKKKKAGEGAENTDGTEIGADGEGGEGADDDDDSDVDSRDDEIEALKDKVQELEEDKEVLEEKVKDLESELQETKEALTAAEEQVEMLEEAEQRWRDKNSVLRIENERLTLYIDRLSSRRADLETDLRKYINETRRLNKLVARRRRRRNLMLDDMERKLAARDRTDVLGLLVRMWHCQAVDDKLHRELFVLEKRRKDEVFGLQRLILVYWEGKIHLEHWVARLQRRLKDAGHRFLLRCASSAASPWALAHAFTAWSAAHSTVFAENRLEDTRFELATTKKVFVTKHTITTRKLDATSNLLDETTADRDRLLDLERELNREVTHLKNSLDDAALDAAEARVRAERAKEEAVRKAVAAVEARMAALEQEFNEEREQFMMEIRTLEGRVAQAEAMAGEGGPGGGGQDESWRVVQKGQGVLCVGCLTQLVHRRVQPLPPLGAIQESKAKGTPRLDKARRQFFEQELNGAPNPDDEIHTKVFMAKKDPYGLSRITVWPEGVKPPPNPPKTAAHADLGSPVKRGSGRWPKISQPQPRKGHGGGGSLGHAASSPQIKMRETFSREFRSQFR